MLTHWPWLALGIPFMLLTALALFASFTELGEQKRRREEALLSWLERH